MTAARMQVRHVMTKDVVTVTEEATLAEAAKEMRSHDVSGVPVVDAAGKVVGILSEKDILRSLEKPMPSSPAGSIIDLVLERGIRAETRLTVMRKWLETNRVETVMTPDPVVIAPDTTVVDAAEIMRERKINRLPVIERGRLVGIVARHDVLSAL